MSVFLNILFLALGFAALIKGADFFVDGSASLARTFKVPSVIIGLTIVAMGTSAPELAVSTSAAIKGSNEIALSNVTGSNIFNLLAVLGICALIRPIPIDRAILKRDFPLSIIISFIVFAVVGIKLLGDINAQSIGMSTVVSEISRPLAIALLVVFALYITYLIYKARKNRETDDAVEATPIWKSILLILIGLTVVAVGTSLPELVTSVIASRKGENGLAVGNVVGSNLFNIMFILGVSGTIHPIAVNFASVIDLGILIIVSVITLVFCLTKKISRIESAVMLALYAATVVFAVLR